MSKAALLANTWNYKDIELPCGVVVTIRSLPASTFLSFNEGESIKSEPMIAQSVVDEDRKPMFSDEEIDSIGELLSVADVMALTKEIIAFNGLDGKANLVEEAEKN